MDGLSLLQQARAVGLVVIAEGNRLRIRGPKRADPVARRILEHKAAVLEVLSQGGQPAFDNGCRELPIEWWQVWDERAAIMEHDGKLPRKWAEAFALVEVVQLMQRAASNQPRNT